MEAPLLPTALVVVPLLPTTLVVVVPLLPTALMVVVPLLPTALGVVPLLANSPGGYFAAGNHPSPCNVASAGTTAPAASPAGASTD